MYCCCRQLVVIAVRVHGILGHVRADKADSDVRVGGGGVDLLPTPGNGTTRILDPAGRNTLRNTFGFDHLVLALDLAAEIQPAANDNNNNGISPPTVIRETYATKIAMRDVVVSLSLFVSANSVTLFGVPIGSISHAKNTLGCLLMIVNDTKITKLVVVVDVEAPTLHGLDNANEGTGHLIRAVAKALLAMYGRVLSNALLGRNPIFPQKGGLGPLFE